eukprot:5120142-Amphidinium_carterae.1
MEPRLGRHEALLIDTGAVGNLTGADWISRAKNVSRTSSNSGALLHIWCRWSWNRHHGAS